MELLKQYLNEWAGIARTAEPGQKIVTPHLWVPAKFETDNGFNMTPPEMVTNERWRKLTSDHPLLFLTEIAGWKMMAENDNPDFFDEMKKVIVGSGVYETVKDMTLKQGFEPDLLTAFCMTCKIILFPGKQNLPNVWWKDEKGITPAMNEIGAYYIECAKRLG